MVAARRLIADRRGIAAIEFVLIVPIMAIIVMILIEVMVLFAGDLTLEAGARAAARYGLTGAKEAGMTRDEVIREIVTGYVCPSALPDPTIDRCYWATNGPMSLDEKGGLTPLFIATRTFADPSNIGIGEPFVDEPPLNGRWDSGEPFTDINGNEAYDGDTGTAGAGGPNDFVVYRIGIWQEVQSPMLRAAIGGQHLFHEARIVIRNEPY